MSGTPEATATKKNNRHLRSTLETLTHWFPQIWIGPDTPRHFVQRQPSLPKSADGEQRQYKGGALFHHWWPHHPLTVLPNLECCEHQAIDPQQRPETKPPKKTKQPLQLGSTSDHRLLSNCAKNVIELKQEISSLLYMKNEHADQPTA